MKKQLFHLLLMCLICLYTVGCSENEAPKKGTPEIISANSNSDYYGTETQNITSVKDTKDADTPNAKDTKDTQETKDTKSTVDVDLTVMSSTMIYAEVYNMMSNPEDYMRKTIKIDGLYYASYYDETDQYYHYVIIEDATACCQSGLEFIWIGEHTYPDDYPKEQTRIEISGIFECYEELGEIYYYLAVDNLF